MTLSSLTISHDFGHVSALGSLSLLKHEKMCTEMQVEHSRLGCCALHAAGDIHAQPACQTLRPPPSSFLRASLLTVPFPRLTSGYRACPGRNATDGDTQVTRSRSPPSAAAPTRSALAHPPAYREPPSSASAASAAYAQQRLQSHSRSELEL